MMMMVEACYGNCMAVVYRFVATKLIKNGVNSYEERVNKTVFNMSIIVEIRYNGLVCSVWKNDIFSKINGKWDTLNTICD